MADCSVIRYRGCLAAVFGDATTTQLQQVIAQYETEVSATVVTPHSEWHVTLITKDELKMLSPTQIDEALALPPRFFPIGLGAYPSHGVYFIVCVWPKAQAFRQRIGLPRQDFHVTISHKNKHDVDKTFRSLVDAPRAIASLTMPALEALSRELLLESNYDDAFMVASLLCERFGNVTSRGWMRLGDAALATDRSKLAMLSYARALSDNLEPATVTYCETHMVRCSASTEWGCLFLENELEQIPSVFHHQLLRRWSPTVRERVAAAVSSSSSLSLPSREHLHALSYDHVGLRASPLYSLPRFFRWVVPFVLAGMSTPRREEDIEQLARSIEIRHVVTLTEEEPLPAEWFAKYPTITNTFLPVKNYKAPTIEQIDLFMGLFSRDDNSSLPVLVHCGGGKGRAGVMLACYLVAYGFRAPIPATEWVHPAMTGAAAIEALRLLRPGSIETTEQEDAVSLYCSLLWKRQSVLPKEVAEPLPSMPEIQGDVAETDLLFLCGLPGSGKSSFRTMLMKRVRANEDDHRGGSRRSSSPKWIELSGDEHGRAGCERSIGSCGSAGRVILDRCNGKPEDRKLFLSLAATWSRHATAVWFDFPKELCESRAQRRAAHPTLPPGQRVRHAIADHSKQFVPPQLAEGFQSVVRITSTEAARVLVETLSSPLRLVKFPRTPHLINLGAATPDDLVLVESAHPDIAFGRPLLDTEIVITEKVDGANLGISLDHTGVGFVVQNRSHYVSSDSHPQFRKLDAFVQQHRGDLMQLLARDPLFPERYILFGEWLAATHSIPYTRLESLFYVFSMYDRETHRFFDRRAMELLMRDIDIPLARLLWRGAELPAKAELIAMVQQPSAYYDGRVEGVYITWEKNGTVKERAKVVRSDFICGNEHWTRGPLRLNEVVPKTA